MTTLKNILNKIAIITTGAILSSLWITHSDSWKYYLPVCLLCITATQSFELKK